MKDPDRPPVCYDVDDTLILWDIPDNFPSDQLVRVRAGVTKDGSDAYHWVAPNQRIINLLEKDWSRGKPVIVWSQGGASWAEHVCQQLGIENSVSMYLTKPDVMYDDLYLTEWCYRYIIV